MTALTYAIQWTLRVLLLVTLGTLMWLLLTPVDVLASNRVCHVQTKAVVLATPVIQQVAPYHYYSTGAAVQEQAVADRIADAVFAKLVASAATVARMEATSGHDAPAAPIEALGAPHQSAFGPMVTKSCVGCHNPVKKSGGFDFTQPITCEQFTKKVLPAVMDNKMPKPAVEGQPSGFTDPALAGQVIRELMNGTK